MFFFEVEFKGFDDDGDEQVAAEVVSYEGVRIHMYLLCIFCVFIVILESFGDPFADDGFASDHVSDIQICKP